MVSCSLEAKMKKKSIIIPTLCFIGALFFAAFVLIEFHKDYLAVAGAGAVLLIATYFLVDKFEVNLLNTYESDKHNILKRVDDTTSNLEDKLNKVETIQKAIYVAINRETKLLEQELEQIKTTMHNNH